MLFLTPDEEYIIVGFLRQGALLIYKFDSSQPYLAINANVENIQSMTISFSQNLIYAGFSDGSLQARGLGLKSIFGGHESQNGPRTGDGKMGQINKIQIRHLLSMVTKQKKFIHQRNLQ